MAGHLFRYDSEAIAEAYEAYEWYGKRSESAADRFWEELVDARRQVQQMPHAWTPYLYGTRCYLFRKFPYGIVYIEYNETIIGIAVCHLHRRPGYWRGRLPVDP